MPDTGDFCGVERRNLLHILCEARSKSAFESLSATEVGRFKGVERTILRQEEIYVFIVEAYSARKKREAEVFALHGITRSRDSGNGLRKFLFGEGVSVLSRVNLGKCREGFPLQRCRSMRVRGQLCEEANGGLEFIFAKRELSREQFLILRTFRVGVGC